MNKIPPFVVSILFFVSIWIIFTALYRGDFFIFFAVSALLIAFLFGWLNPNKK